jgi:hypothetical protein
LQQQVEALQVELLLEEAVEVGEGRPSLGEEEEVVVEA